MRRVTFGQSQCHLILCYGGKSTGLYRIGQLFVVSLKLSNNLIKDV